MSADFIAKQHIHVKLFGHSIAAIWPVAAATALARSPKAIRCGGLSYAPE